MSTEVHEALTRGEALGRYIVIEPLGQGAMGSVYAAYDPELDRKVAIKILRRKEGDATELRRQARFVREAKAIARLAHPNVVGIFDVGVHDGRVFLAMEYLAGGTLREWMAAKERPWREIVKMFVEVGRGLAAAHAEGLVHRDFKPDNVLLDRARTPKVADFGLARLSGPASAESGDDVSEILGPSGSGSSDEVPLTRTGALAGTPAYMAPEQFRGKSTDGRTDQFAFCVALHEALYGARPFNEDTVFELAESVIREHFKPPAKNANVPGWIRRSLLRGLRADPAQRYAKVEDLLAALTADPVARARRVVLASVVTVAVAATTTGLYRRSEHRRIEFEGRVASKLNDGRLALSDAKVLERSLTDARSRAFEAFDGPHRDDGESLWALARADALKLESTLKRAQAAFEAVLTLDQSNERARADLSEAVLGRAALAELEARRSDLEHHLELMQRIDPSGDLAARWARPAALDVTTSPPGAHLIIERYRADDDGTRRLAPVAMGEAVTSPIVGRSLPPGSYRVTGKLAGFAPARLPFIVRRGEHLRLELPLLTASEVPRGFVYVPAGRFLYGDADEDGRVAFLNAPPIHERSTDAFFIAAHETTFGEWLEFLGDLPPDERHARTPSSVSVQTQGSVALHGSPAAGWTLDLNVSGTRLMAKQGSPVVNPKRHKRASQDWLRMPVIGISHRDMQAYVDWLSRTRRVPGARFCTELEWERAARGADGRDFPASNGALSGDDANIDVTYGRAPGAYGPDEVGAHPSGDSPFGISDMAGNVWEVVSTSREVSGSLMRGGSYYQSHTSARSTNREPTDLGLRSFLLGMRVCASAGK